MVRFGIEPSADASALSLDTVCAVIDVTSNGGHERHAYKEIVASDFAGGRKDFALAFTLGQRTVLEYRVWVSGALPLQLDDYQQVSGRLHKDDERAVLDRLAFPAGETPDAPFFAENRDYFRSLYEQGCEVGLDGDAVLLTVQNVTFRARSKDDVNFIQELFFDNVYNFQLDRPVCVIDIGMNIGLSALIFAHKADVKEVHSFEPFGSTFDRAVTNIQSIGAAGQKIHPHNFGLSDRNWDGEILVSQDCDSGAMNTVESGLGTPMRVALRDAGEVLAPIFENARADGRDVIVKIDCEGSEFAIFESLRANALLGHVTAFMVEWHAMFDDKTQADLTRPLREHGFIIFDRSPPSGNGFFYAARLGSDSQGRVPGRS